MWRLKLKKGFIGLVVAALIMAGLGWSPKVFAGTLTNTSVLELGSGATFANPMIASDAQQLAVQFKLATASPTSATLVFSAGTATSGSIPLTGTGCTTYFPGDTAIGGVPTASGSSATITISTLSGLGSTAVTYCMLLGNSTTAAYTNSTAAVYTDLMTIGSDSQTDAFDVLSSGANAYSITGTVASTFTMTLASGTDTFPSNLSSSAVVVSNGDGVTIATNAASGWNVYARDANAGLKSASAGNHVIGTVSTGSAHTMNGGTIGTEAYALGVDVDFTTNYQYSSGTAGSGLATASYNQIATSASPSAGTSTTFTPHELADISATTPPGSDYTDTITLIGAGSF